MHRITVTTTVKAPIEKIWDCWTQPKHIMQWNAASDDWETSAATNDVRTGGTFSSTMRAKDKSVSFDFNGTYTNVRKHELLAYSMADGRNVEVTFVATTHGVTVTETFDPEHENSEELQRQGWQAILNNFKKHVERHN